MSKQNLYKDSEHSGDMGQLLNHEKIIFDCARHGLIRMSLPVMYEAYWPRENCSTTLEAGTNMHLVPFRKKIETNSGLGPGSVNRWEFGQRGHNSKFVGPFQHSSFEQRTLKLAVNLSV